LVLGHYDVELPAARGGEQRLIARALCGAAADGGVRKAGNLHEVRLFGVACADTELIGDAFGGLFFGAEPRVERGT
jgi:hypothetical protein